MNKVGKNCYQSYMLKGAFLIIILFLSPNLKAQEKIELYTFPSSHLIDIEVDKFGNKFVLLFSRADSIYGNEELLFTKPMICASEENCEGLYYLLALNKEYRFLYYKYFSSSAEYDNSVFSSDAFWDIDVYQSTLTMSGIFRSDSFYSSDLSLSRAQEAAGANLIILQYSLYGDLLSYKQFESPTWHDCTSAKIEKRESTTIVAGRHFDTMYLDHIQLTPFKDNDNNVFIGKVGSDFQTEWATSIGGRSWDWLSDVKIDYDNNILVLGDYTQPPILIGGDTSELSQSDFDGVFLMKFDNKGRPVWQNQVIGKSVRSVSIGLMDDNSFYMVGRYTASTAQFGEHTINSPTNLFNVYIAKYTQHGAIEWVKQLNTDFYSDVSHASVDEDGNLWFTGHFRSNNKFGIGKFEFNEPGGKGDIYIAKFSPNGEALYATVFGGLEWEIGTHILPLGNGRMLFCGRTTSLKMPINTDTIYNPKDGVTPFIFEFLDPTVQLTKLEPKACKSQIFPNPIIRSNFLHIQREDCLVDCISQLNLIDINGTTVYNKVLQFPYETLYIPNIPAGMYFLEFNSNLGREIKKLIVL